MYGLIFKSTILEDAFAKSHGIIETLAHYKFLNEPEVSSSFVKNRFNNSSVRYEKVQKLSGFEDGELGIMISTLNAFKSKETFVDWLDLGCGSGLVGAEISDDKIFLTGVDLSEKMLEIANRKKII